MCECNTSEHGYKLVTLSMYSAPHLLACSVYVSPAVFELKTNSIVVSLIWLFIKKTETKPMYGQNRLTKGP